MTTSICYNLSGIDWKKELWQFTKSLTKELQKVWGVNTESFNKKEIFLDYMQIYMAAEKCHDSSLHSWYVH